MTSHEHAGGSQPRLVDHLNARGTLCTGCVAAHVGRFGAEEQ